MTMVSTRSATLADVPAIRRLLVETWHATYDHIFGVERVTAITDDWHREERLVQAVGRPDHRFLVAEADGALLGTASSTLGSGGRLSLDRLYVRPDVQGAGIGTLLLAAAVSGWPGLRRIELQVEPRNVPAIAFYRRHGFVPAPAPTSGCVVEHLVMRRHLPPAGYSIRPAEPDEAAAILGVVRQAVSETNARDYAPDAIAFILGEISLASVSAHLAQWDVWVVTDREGAIRGTASFDGSRVRQVFVAPACQGQGLGAVLMDAVERAALDAGLDRLGVRSSLTAVPFYQGRGFVARDATSWGPAPMVPMERRLSAA